MSKGSGRRRIVPADGIKYDPETEEVDEVVARSFEGNRYGLSHGFRHGAQPTCQSYYGTHGKHWAGKGRKNDYRSWKPNKENQYEE